MLPNLTKRRHLLLWQALVLVVGTTWLWAPHLNHNLSYRTSLVSQYEVPFEPYAWLFRTCDLLTGALVAGMGFFMLKKRLDRKTCLLLLVVGAGMMLDPALATTCRQVGKNCQEYFS